MAQLPAGNVPLIQALLQWLRPRPQQIDPLLWQQVCQRVPWIGVLTQARQLRLRELTTRFLHSKGITPVGDVVLDDNDRVMLAALCCLPLLELGEAALRGWSQVLVYPEGFVVPQVEVDESQVQHEWEDDAIGLAVDGGPLLVSWQDVLHELQHPHEGGCVVVHEMAHRIDMLDGLLDGSPPLPRPWQQEWARDFQAAYDALCAQVDAGEETVLDPYATSAPEEFFAVMSEYHFAAPALLAAELPAVAAHLQRLYGPTPAG